MRVLSVCASLATLVGAALAWNGTYQQNLSFPLTPDYALYNITYNVYEPPKLVAHAPLVLAPHCGHCNASFVYQTYGLNDYADQYGFPIIYPDNPIQGWDISSFATNKHNAGGDALILANMVRHAIATYKSDPGRVFIVGWSGGAFMTTDMVATYPELFAAAGTFSSMPLGCMVDPEGRINVVNAVCNGKNITRTGRAWAQSFYDAYPGYHRYRPKMLVYHGTADVRCNFVPYYAEIIKQWTSLLHVSPIPVSIVENLPNTPTSNRTMFMYGRHNEIQAHVGVGDGHNDPNLGTLSFNFFQLGCPAGDPKCLRRPDIPVPKPTPCTEPFPTKTKSTPCQHGSQG